MAYHTLPDPESFTSDCIVPLFFKLLIFFNGARIPSTVLGFSFAGLPVSSSNVGISTLDEFGAAEIMFRTTSRVYCH